MAMVLPSGVQQNNRAEHMNVNVSVQSPKADTSVNCHPNAAVISGK